MAREIVVHSPRNNQALRLVFSLLAALAMPALSETVIGTVGIDPSQRAGTDSAGRVLLFTPDPLEPGSSVSHWDRSTFPNLLMEPSVNSDLSFLQLDLTLFQLRDIGWPNGGSNLTLHVQDAAGQGFNDPSSGAARRAAMERALEVYSSRLSSSVEIHVDASFEDLPCDDGTGVLAQAGAQFIFESFPGAPIAGTWYHGALAESLSATNLSLEDSPNPDAGDLALTFNNRIDSACLGSGSRFYYGLDGNVPSGQISFVTVALHELAHGLGFATFTDSETGEFVLGKPDIYSRFVYDNSLGRTWNQMTQAQRRSSAVNSRQVAWSGNQVRAQVPSFLLPGPALLIESPASIAGAYEVGTAAFGPPVTMAGITGEIVEARDASATPTLLCSPVANSPLVAGRIALVDRGDCNFTVKVKNAQNAGAIAVVIANNIAGSPPGLGGSDPTISIPAVSISLSDGIRIREALVQTANPGSLAFTESIFRVDESEDSARISVRRVGGRDGEVTVELAATGGTATAGEDFAEIASTLTFQDGEAGVRAFAVELLDDLVSEGDETIELALVNPGGGATLVAPSVAELVLIDDDILLGGRISLSADRYQSLEGDDRATITVERSGGSRGATTVDYATGGGDAEPGSDYLPTLGTLAFADGEQGQRSFTVDLLDDAEQEPIESIGVALSNVTGDAILGDPSSAMLDIVDDEPCEADGSILCLEEQRFRVEVRWRDFEGEEGRGQTQVLDSEDSGLFWFFGENNLEMLVKVLDGCSVNQHFWVFAAAVTNVEYTLHVTDTLTGQLRQYHNALGISSPAITDTEAFSTCATTTESVDESSPRSSDLDPLAGAPAGLGYTPKRSRKIAAEEATCQGSDQALCLNQSRFEVRIQWKDFADRVGPGQIEPLDSDDSGLFWFFSPNNLEVLVKVLDGCSLNDRFWVFAAATTNVEYTLVVTDSSSGEIVEYHNPLGVSSPAITDTDAFAACP